MAVKPSRKFLQGLQTYQIIKPYQNLNFRLKQVDHQFVENWLEHIGECSELIRDLCNNPSILLRNLKDADSMLVATEKLNEVGVKYESLQSAYYQHVANDNKILIQIFRTFLCHFWETYEKHSSVVRQRVQR